MSLCLPSSVSLSHTVSGQKWKMRTLERGTDAGPLFLYEGEGVVQISQTGIQCWCWCWCLHFQIFDNFKPEMSVRRLLLWSPLCQCTSVCVYVFECGGLSAHFEWNMWEKQSSLSLSLCLVHIHIIFIDGINKFLLPLSLPLALTRYSRIINTALFSSLLLCLSWSFSLILRRFVNENDN